MPKHAKTYDQMTAVDGMDCDELRTLEAAAREHWGDNWTLEITLWSDGSSNTFVFRSRGEVRRDEADQFVERERLYLDSGEVVRDRVIVRDEAVVDVLDERAPLEY